MIQNRTSDNKIKENKYKILRMSLLLGSDDNREETLNNFEDAAREIDAMNDEVYLRDLQKKFYDTTKLEDEEKKLDVLVNYIEGRVEQRISLLSFPLPKTEFFFSTNNCLVLCSISFFRSSSSSF